MSTRSLLAASAATVAGCAGLACGQAFTEGFEGGAIPAGWATQNLSSPLGNGNGGWVVSATGQLPGATAIVPPRTGTFSIYANFNSTSGPFPGGTISNWLFTHQLSNIQNGATLFFYTSTRQPAAFWPDRLQVRLSTAGASTNAGTTATSVGDFTNLLLDINPNYTTTGYPTAWTLQTVPVSGLPGPASGRFAFRYFVEGAGPSGDNSEIAGIDDVEYIPAGVTGACCFLNGTCSVLGAGDCQTQGGVWSGQGVTCAQANCPQPGACCLPDATCQFLAASQCAAIADALYRGNGTTCPSNCATTGACCQLDGTCALRTEAACAGGNGLFRGDGSTCAAANCPTGYPYLGAPVFIVDATGQNGTFCGPEAIAEITVADSFTIAGADVSMFITHQWQGDLVFTLTHVPSNTSVEFYNRVPFGSGGSYDVDNFGASPNLTDLFRVVDSATRFYRTPPAPSNGIPNVRGLWKPDVALAPFAGLNSAGVWRLRVKDCGGPGDIGNVEYWHLSLHRPGPATCYANCDNSTQAPVLNVADFGCFLTRYAAGDPYANCDGSTQAPVLNVADFGCFLTKYAAGCP